MTYNINGKLVELTTDTGIMVNSRQLHYGFSAEHHECEFLCILLSPKLLQGNEWFYQNCVQHITENASCPYVLLPRSGWQASVLDWLTHLYASYADTLEQPMSTVLPEQVITAKYFGSIMGPRRWFIRRCTAGSPLCPFSPSCLSS